VELRSDSEDAVFVPGQKGIWTLSAFCFVCCMFAATLTVLHWRQDSLFGAIIGCVMTVVIFCLGYQHHIYGQRLRVCLRPGFLVVDHYYSTDEIRLAAIRELYENSDGEVVVKTEDRAVILMTWYFASVDDKARFLQLAQTRIKNQQVVPAAKPDAHAH
jgi:hypothetical protein